MYVIRLPEQLKGQVLPDECCCTLGSNGGLWTCPSQKVEKLIVIALGSKEVITWDQNGAIIIITAAAANICVYTVHAQKGPAAPCIHYWLKAPQVTALRERPAK